MGNENINQANFHEDEISLKELITILLNEKKLIAIITLIAVLLSAVYSLFVLKTEYQNSTLINFGMIDSSSESAIETPYGPFENPYKSLDEYIRLVKDPRVLEMTKNELEGKYSSRTISNKISTNIVSDNRSFEIIVKENNDEDAQNLTK